MASGPTTFMIGVVFSPERFQGNRLAIVSVRGNSLTQTRKSLLAKEFGFSETAFLHDAPSPGAPRRLDIFTETGEEIAFAGHPVIGVTHYIFSQLEKKQYLGPTDRDTPPQTGTLITKAGLIPIFFNNYRQLSACSVPHNFHIHQKEVSLEKIIAVQPQLQIVPTIDKVKKRTFPVVSIVKGMTFALVDLTDAPELLAALKAGETPEVDLDEEWKQGFVGALYYLRRETVTRGDEPSINSIHARMIAQGMEDPGTGSACCALASYLALNTASETKAKAKEDQADEELAKATAAVSLGPKLDHHVFAFEQGIEMGRKCMIAVEVDLASDGEGNRKLSNILLSGRANLTMMGQLLGD